MVGVDMVTLQQNDVIQKGLRRMRAMGLDVQLQTEGTEQVYIFVKLDSVLRLISKAIEYPQKEVKYEEPFIVVYLWRG